MQPVEARGLVDKDVADAVEMAACRSETRNIAGRAQSRDGLHQLQREMGDVCRGRHRMVFVSTDAAVGSLEGSCSVGPQRGNATKDCPGRCYGAGRYGAA